jgi:hypothetical protein
MMNQHALDQCLQTLAAGESLEVCLARFPDQRQELEPMLMAVLRLQAVQALQAPPAFRQAGRGRLLAAIEAAPKPIAPTRTPLVQRCMATLAGILQPLRLAPLALRLALALILLTAGTAATAYAAQGAMPGNPLYAVKLVGEDVHLSLATDPVTLRLIFAQRRLDEAQTLQQRGFDRNLPAALARYDQTLLAWTLAAETGGLQDAADASHRLAAQLEQLQTLAQQAPPDQQAPVQASQQALRQALLRLPPMPTPQPATDATDAPTPTLDSRPSATPSPADDHERSAPSATPGDGRHPTPTTAAPVQGGHRGPESTPPPDQTPGGGANRPERTPIPGAPDQTPTPGRTPGGDRGRPEATSTPITPDQTPTPNDGGGGTATPVTPDQTPTPDGHRRPGPATPDHTQTPGGGGHGGSERTPAPGGHGAPHADRPTEAIPPGEAGRAVG